MAQEYTGWDDQEEYKLPKKESKPIDCRSPEGVTVSLIDGIIGMARVIKQRIEITGITPAIKEALMDLGQDEDVYFIIKLCPNK